MNEPDDITPEQWAAKWADKPGFNWYDLQAEKIKEANAQVEFVKFLEKQMAEGLGIPPEFFKTYGFHAGQYVMPAPPGYSAFIAELLAPDPTTPHENSLRRVEMFDQLTAAGYRLNLLTGQYTAPGNWQT